MRGAGPVIGPQLEGHRVTCTEPASEALASGSVPGNAAKVFSSSSDWTQDRLGDKLTPLHDAPNCVHATVFTEPTRPQKGRSRAGTAPGWSTLQCPRVEEAECPRFQSTVIKHRTRAVPAELCECHRFRPPFYSFDLASFASDLDASPIVSSLIRPCRK